MKKSVIIKKGLINCVLIVLLVPAVSFAGAWTMPKGHTYNRIAVNSYYADELFTDSGRTSAMADHGEFLDRNISYYMEHGVMDQLTLIFSSSFKSLTSENDFQKSENNAFSDIDLGLRYRLLRGKYGVLSLQGGVKIPEAYDDNESIAPGNGQYDVSAKMQWGRSLYPVIPGYFNVEAGYRLRAKEPADEFLYLLELGVDITKKIYGRIKYDAIIGMDNADNTGTSTGNPSFAKDYDLVKADLAFGYRINGKWAVELEGLKEVSGKSVSKGVTYSVAVSVML
jgi:hypothetical protein